MAVPREHAYGTYPAPTTTEKEVVAGTTQMQLSAEDGARISVSYFNDSDTVVYIADTTAVATASGWPIPSKTGISFDQAEAVSARYVITTAATKAVRVIEVVRA